MQLFSCDNPRVMFSTARPLDRQNAYVARAFSISPNPETAVFGFDEGASSTSRYGGCTTLECAASAKDDWK